MAVKKITRKVISPSKKVAAPKESPVKAEVTETARPKKVCSFCQSKTDPVYTDTQVLRRFTSDRAKIVPRAKSGLCSKHQRGVTRNIKYARHLSLLPFIQQV